MATMNAPSMDRRTSPERRTAAREGRGSAMSALDYLAMFLLIIGGLNWALVGLAALYSIYTTAKMAGAKRH